MSKVQRAVAHYAARRIMSRGLRRFALLRFLPQGLVAMLVAEGMMLAWKELQKRPEFRQRLWQSLCAGMSRRLSAR